MTAHTGKLSAAALKSSAFEDFKNLINLSYGDVRLLFGRPAVGQGVKNNVDVAIRNIGTGRRLPDFSYFL